MALNSFVTASGGEMGRAQIVQAEAAGIQPEVEMNPILLKPTGNNVIQVILQGQVYGNMTAGDYYRQKPFFFEKVLRCHTTLSERFELLVIEGAGSPVEMNLLDRDIVNLPLARALHAPCLLVADIDRGGIFASIIGTHALCSGEDRSLIRGFIVNKFRGQESLFTDGVQILETRTGWPCLGIVPHSAWLELEEEDSVALESKQASSLADEDLNIAVVRLPHLSNYTDFDPLEQSNACLTYARRPEELGSADLVILPGTKNTLEDLLWLKQQGFKETLQSLSKARVPILGICGGLQMLGLWVRDPQGVESDQKEIAGLGLLELETTLAAEKITCQVEALHLESGEPVKGYEIHMGRTRASAELEPLFRVLRRRSDVVDELDGVQKGNLSGTYLHGIFENQGFTRFFLGRVAAARGKPFSFRSRFSKEKLYNRWADLLAERIRLDLLEEIVGLPIRARLRASSR